ncbi:DUF1361 domain-containing protein [Winogradskyella jejuensis]|uniref:Uncharacterized membrane protein n=1 Tax=Winogradskyella jejuensis TaxID=1089305 RepID=A0A1M5KB47_9FLAO|nr:DUF1361 domain-containing protein [Winogradskyella jejuensis]SHG50134.1 Uncharacterized membrane protein [Winogradskyella jejuensis]
MKRFLVKKYDTLSVLISAICMSGLLLILRVKLNKSFFYLFLVWNIVLAIVPYAITMYLSSVKLNRLKLILWFCVWVLFLPNAPYIITDLLHLRVSNSYMLWLDILVILSFAGTGLLLFFLSLNDMRLLLNLHFKKLQTKYLMTVIVFLCAFGVYLGRYLRYNSWEILSKPQRLFSDILEMITNPFNNSEAWLFTFGFGIFLYVGFRIFRKLYSFPST